MSSQVFVVGVGMTRFGRHPDKSVKELTREAVEQALADGGCGKTDGQAAFFGNSTQGHMEGQDMIRGELALRSMGMPSLPVVNVQNASAPPRTTIPFPVN